MTTLAKDALRERITRELEKRHEEQRGSLYEFIKKYRKQEKKTELDDNWHIKAICEKLEGVYS
jgi:hypothetical protein